MATGPCGFSNSQQIVVVINQGITLRDCAHAFGIRRDGTEWQVTYSSWTTTRNSADSLSMD